MSVPQSKALGLALSWAGSAVAAAAVLSGVAVLVVAMPPPGESRGQVAAPVVLTLAAPEAVAALPTPPPEISSDAPDAPMPPDAELQPRQAVVDAPPVIEAAPRLAARAAMADAPVVADDVPPPAAQVAQPVPQPVPQPVAKPQAPAQKPTIAPAKPAVESSVAASVAGDAGKTPKASRNDGVKASTAAAKQATQRWASTIRKRIEARKAYPAAAKGAQGTVTVRLTVSRAGQLLGVAVVQSSGVAALDKAAVRAVQTARFPAAPEGVADDSASFALPMKFAD